MTIYPKAYNADAQLWFAKQIVKVLSDQPLDPHPLSRNGDLADRIKPEFEKKFPNLNFSDYLFICIREREESLKLIQKYRSIGADNHIDLSTYLKNRIGLNPNLSQGAARYNLTHSLQVCRAELCDEVDRIYRSLRGIQMDNDYVAHCVKQIQRHVLSEPAPDLLYDSNQSIPERLLQFQLLTIPSSEYPETHPTDLRYNSAHELLDALSKLSENDIQNIYYEIFQCVAFLTQEKPENLWPDLIGHEEFIMDLVKKISEHSSTKEMIQVIKDLIDVAEFVPEDMQKFSQPTIEEHLKRKKLSQEYQNVVQHLGFSTFMESIPRARRILSFEIRKQLEFFVATHLHRSQPPPIVRFIRTWAEKKFSETMADPAVLVKKTSAAIRCLADYAKSTVRDDPIELKSCDYCDEDDMIWATLPPSTEDQEPLKSLTVFDCRSPLFTSLWDVFLKYYSPHPLLVRERILQEWEEQYCKRFPQIANRMEIVRGWAERYLKYMWYIAPKEPQITKFKNLPTICLFLEWHAANLILQGLTDREQLIQQLKLIVDQSIPSYPVSESDIENTVFRLLHDYRRINLN